MKSPPVHELIFTRAVIAFLIGRSRRRIFIGVALLLGHGEPPLCIPDGLTLRSNPNNDSRLFIFFRQGCHKTTSSNDLSAKRNNWRAKT
jgi:hypothetical protein